MASPYEARSAVAWLRAEAALFAVVAAVAVFWLQMRAIHCGEMRGFDTLIYGRGIWGVAHGDFWNTVRNTHVFAVHANWVNFVLAPFTYVAKAADVLAAWQAVALFVTTYLVTRASQLEHSRLSRRMLFGLMGFVCGVLATAFVINPFLFDPRPDLMIVPLMTAAFLRVRRVGDWDRTALLIGAAAVLVREEAAILLAFALFATPRREELLSRRARIILASVLVGYVAFYHLGIRGALGTQSVLHPLRDFTPSESVSEVGATPSIVGKLTLVAAAFLGGAPFLWRGRRWILPVIPSLALLAALQFRADDQIVLHYTLFSAPGILLAVLEGFRVAVRRHLQNDLLAAPVIAAANLFLFTTWPGAQNYVPRYALEPLDIRQPLACLAEDAKLFNQQLARIPANASVVVSSAIGARLADRANVFTTIDIDPGRLDLAPDYIVFFRLHFSTLADDWRALAMQLGRFGYRSAGYESRAAMIFTRDKRAHSIDWRTYQNAGPKDCEHPEARFTDAGLEICATAEVHDGALGVLVHRFAEPRSTAARSFVQLSARPRGGPAVPLGIHYGLAPLSEAPIGFYGWVTSNESVSQDRGVRILLTDADGRNIQPDR